VHYQGDDEPTWELSDNVHPSISRTPYLHLCSFSQINSLLVSAWDKREYKDGPLYVCDPVRPFYCAYYLLSSRRAAGRDKPGTSTCMTTTRPGESPKAQMSESCLRHHVTRRRVASLSVGSSNATAIPSRTRRSKVGALVCLLIPTFSSAGKRTAGLFVQTFMCGVILALDELYNAESKTQVVLSHARTVRRYGELKKKMVPLDCYDDACHFNARLESLMGMDWAFAALAAMDHATDVFHFSNHVDEDCVVQTSPYKRPLLNVSNAHGALPSR
jgi:hypothetical protein